MGQLSVPFRIVAGVYLEVGYAQKCLSKLCSIWYIKVLRWFLDSPVRDGHNGMFFINFWWLIQKLPKVTKSWPKSLGTCPILSIPMPDEQAVELATCRKSTALLLQTGVVGHVIEDWGAGRGWWVASLLSHLSCHIWLLYILFCTLMILCRTRDVTSKTVAAIVTLIRLVLGCYCPCLRSPRPIRRSTLVFSKLCKTWRWGMNTEHDIMEISPKGVDNWNLRN